MISQPLHTPWQFRQAGDKAWLPAEVPGCTHTDLLRLGKIPDPFFRDNELKAHWVACADWEYRLDFDPDPELYSAECIHLVCEGLDTLARVYLNGALLGETDNMFRKYRWEVTQPLRPSGNTLRILFSSPVNYVSQRRSVRILPGGLHSIPGASYLRKSPSQYGWDWAPKLPPVGIWRDIRLEGYRFARFEDVHLRQHHLDGKVNVEAALSVERWSGESLEVLFRLVAPDGREQEARIALAGAQGNASIDVEAPRLWWPNGYGEQPLYRAEVVLLHNQQEIDRHTYQLGLRTVSLSQVEDGWGKSFTFLVNGVPIFIKGSNWVPADSFPNRITSERYDHLIRSAAQSHQNMLRVWGGGYYEDERFYDLCDRYGLLIWQEMMFACSVYPLDDRAFRESVKDEVRDNVRRLRHRACLALWCGNNEMELGWEIWGWDVPALADMKAGYDEFFHRTLPGWIVADDPDHAYWPSSPSSQTSFVQVNGQEQGDTHYWEVWHGGEPFTAYQDQFPRFMSEFGFQSLPPMDTIRSFAEPRDWDIRSSIMDHHQRCPEGNALIARQMSERFREPRDFPSQVYLSMVLQAEGIRYGVEHWRRNRQRVSGTLYWQLNDCWPAASWSSIDYYGRWKALHYAARRFYAPVLLSLVERDDVICAHITNDLLAPLRGKVVLSLVTLGGYVLERVEREAEVDALASAEVASFSPLFSAGEPGKVVLVADLFQDGFRQQTAVFTLVPDRLLQLADPELQVQVNTADDGIVIDISARSLARFVELKLEGSEEVFSDNYFDLPAGRTAQVECKMPPGWSLERAKRSLQVRSLVDSYA